MTRAVPHRRMTIDKALASLSVPEHRVGQASSHEPVLDVDALFPRPARYAQEYLLALAESTQTPAEMPLLLGLAVASACVCNVAKVRGYGDHVEPAPIWSLVLAESASRKSAVVAELVAPIVAWERRRSVELGPEIAEAHQRRRIMEKRLRQLEDAAARPDDPKGAKAATDAIALATEITSERLPEAPLLLTSEPTPEALAMQMARNGGRALVASAEGGLLDIAKGLYSGAANFDLLLKAHAGDAVRAPRVGRQGDMIDSPSLAMALCIQPEAVRALWSDRYAAGRGLLARFALCWPEDRIGRRKVRPTPVVPSLRTHWCGALDRLLVVEPRTDPVVVGLSEEADAIFEAFQEAVERRLGEGDLADRRAWGGKLCGLTLRVALTLHAISTWALMGRPEDFLSIDVDTMRAAIAWANWLARAERDARERLLEPEPDRRQRELVAWIEERGGTVTIRDLQRGPRQYRKLPDATNALEGLVRAGVAERVVLDHDGGRGRSTDAYRLVGEVGGTGDGDTNGAGVQRDGISVAVAASQGLGGNRQGRGRHRITTPPH